MRSRPFVRGTLMSGLSIVALGVGFLITQTVVGSTGTCDAVAHHEDASHSGSSCTALPAAPSQLWSVNLDGNASYPIIADGNVYVTTGAPSGSGGTLYALSQSTGDVVWGPVPISSSYFWFGLAYDNGTLFVNNFDGTVTAFNGSTGQQLWATPTSNFSGEPIAYDGVVYVQGSDSVMALSESTGIILWESPPLDGDGSARSQWTAPVSTWLPVARGSGSRSPPER